MTVFNIWFNRQRSTCLLRSEKRQIRGSSLNHAFIQQNLRRRDKTRRPASADRTARAANYIEGRRTLIDGYLESSFPTACFAVIKMELSGKTVYGPVLKTVQLSAHAQNHASPERCRKSFTMIFLGDHDIPLAADSF